MSDLKSKLPDLKEVAGMAGKLFNDIKDSISEIVQDYKEKRCSAAEVAEKAEKAPKKKPAEKPVKAAGKPAKKTAKKVDKE